MIETYNERNIIKCRKDFSYDKVVPTFITNNWGGTDEIARWVLDVNDTPYKNEVHAPYIYSSTINKVTGNKNGGVGPALITTDSLIYTTNSLVQYCEQHALPSKKLVPADPTKKKEVLDLYNLFVNEYDESVKKYVYSHLLANPSVGRRLFTKGVDMTEKITFSFNFSSISAALLKELNLAESKPEEHLNRIKKTFDQVNNLLSDGRKYLTGNTITIADVAFAAVSSPLILPEEFGGTLARISDLPDELRKEVVQLRETPAGQFVLCLYQEDRPPKRAFQHIPNDPNILAKIAEKLKISLSTKKSNLFYFLQKHYPVLKLPPLKLMTVNKNDLVKELLERDNDFTVEEINSKKMADQRGAFFFGLG